MEQAKAYALDGTLAAGAFSFHWWGAHLDQAEHLIAILIGLAIGLPRAYVAWSQARQWWNRRPGRARP